MLSTLRGFAHQAKQALVGAPNKSQGLKKRAGADLLDKPVVLDSNDGELNGAVLSLLLQTIFERHPDLIDIVGSRLAFTAELATISGAESAIEKIIMEALANDEKDACVMAADFFAHKTRTQENARAYSPAQRKNPNAVFWPNPKHPEYPRSIYDELPFVESHPFITRTTKIVSMGSCFAMEIAHMFQEEGYNYVVTEPNACPNGSYYFTYHETTKYPQSSAAWGTHFNTPSFLQVVEKAFGYRRPDKILWTNFDTKGKLVYCDPFREEICFPSIEAFEYNYDRHIKAAREALLQAEVLVMTLGLNEVWYFKPDGSVFSRSPWKTAPSLVEHRVLTVEENVQALRRLAEIMKEHNPNCKLLITLSPIPLHATFLGDHRHIIEANTHSKAVLRVAAEEFVNSTSNAYYFPSYELVTNCIEKPWSEDQRHVKRETVADVMAMFKKMYCAG